MKKFISLLLFTALAFVGQSQTLVNLTATKQYDENGNTLSSTQTTVYVSIGNISSVLSSGSGALVYMKEPVKNSNGSIWSYSVTSTPAQVNTAVSASVSAFALSAGSVGAPTGAWSNEAASGWYRIGANDYGYSINGALVQEIAAAGVSMSGLTTMTNAAIAGSVLTQGAVRTYGTPQTLTGAGAVNLTTYNTLLVTTAADALTLAAGTEGLHKFIRMKTDGGDGTLTVTNLQGGTTITFDDAGDFVELYYLDGKWHIIVNSGCTVA